MGPLFAGALLGALVVVLALVAVYFNGKYRAAAQVARQFAVENAKLDLELRKTVATLQDAITPITVKIGDEQAMRMAHVIATAIEQLRKAELTGMN